MLVNFKPVTAHQRQENDKFSKIEILQKSVFTTDLALQKSGVKQIFPDLALAPTDSTHIKAQTDGWISHTIFGIQSSDPKRRHFPANFGHSIEPPVGPPPGLAE